MARSIAASYRCLRTVDGEKRLSFVGRKRGCVFLGVELAGCDLAVGLDDLVMVLET
jgi:hypothetical protein